MKLRLTITFLTLLSCSETHKGVTKTLDFKDFSIQVPATWQQVRAKGIDSFVGQIALDDGDTASFDLGWYSNSLDEQSINDKDSTNPE